MNEQKKQITFEWTENYPSPDCTYSYTLRVENGIFSTTSTSFSITGSYFVGASLIGPAIRLSNLLLFASFLFHFSFVKIHFFSSFLFFFLLSSFFFLLSSFFFWLFVSSSSSSDLIEF